MLVTTNIRNNDSFRQDDSVIDVIVPTKKQLFYAILILSSPGGAV